MTLTENDLALLAKKGISEKKVHDQIETFKEGIPFVQLEKAVTVGEGLSKFTQAEEKELIQKFDASQSNLSLLKFVPASGAASRMFKALFNFLDAYDPSKETLDSYFERTNDKALKAFSEGMTNFAFYDLVKQRIAGKTSFKDEEV